MNINMSKLSINLSAAMTRHDVLSLGELMAHPEVVTDDVAGPTSAKRRTLRGSLFTVQEPPKAASAVLIRRRRGDIGR